MRAGKRTAFMAAALGLLAGFADAQDSVEGMAPTGRESPTRLYLEMTGETITLLARRVTVEEILEEIARRCGLVVVSREPLDESVTLELYRFPFPRAMRRILRDRSYTAQYVRTLSGNSSVTCPSRLWVFSKGSGGDRSPYEDTSGSSTDQEFAPGKDAVRNVAALDTDEMSGDLSLALADDDATVRLAAVSTLAGIRSEQAAAALATAALSDEDASVREEAIFALSGIADQPSVQVLRQALMDPDNKVRETAIEVFGEIGGAESAQALAFALNDPDDSVRAEAVDALGEIGGATAVRILDQALADEQDFVREAAAEYLVELSQH